MYNSGTNNILFRKPIIASVNNPVHVRGIAYVI